MVAGRKFQPWVIFRTHTGQRSLNRFSFFINSVQTGAERDNGTVFLFLISRTRRDMGAAGVPPQMAGVSLTWWEVHYLTCSKTTDRSANAGPLHRTGCTTCNRNHSTFIKINALWISLVSRMEQWWIKRFISCVCGSQIDSAHTQWAPSGPGFIIMGSACVDYIEVMVKPCGVP